MNFVGSAEACEKWADAVVVNNHFDTDGLLSIWVVLDPEQAMANRDLLIAAAEAGDFDEWPALERGLWLDAAIRALGSGAADDATAYQTVLPQLPELIQRLDQRRDLWGREWDDLQAAVAALESGRLLAESHGAVGLMIHAPGQSEAPGPLLCRRFLPAAGATCWPLIVATAVMITAMSALIMPGPIQSCGRCCQHPMPARWRCAWAGVDRRGPAGDDRDRQDASSCI